MSLIGKEIESFEAQAYHNGKFIDVSSEDFKGKWNVVCFTQQIFHLYVQRN